MRAGVGAVLALGALCLSACKEKPELPALEDVQAARQAAMRLDVKIRQDVLSRLDHESAVAVYLAYRDTVPGMVREAGREAGFDVRRIGLRVRSPANIPDEWEAAQMEQMDALVSAGYDISILEKSEIVKEITPEGERRWMRWIKPIGMSEDCMACHGDHVAPEILTLLKQDYVEDEATGYYEYEMRGAYSVRILLSGSPVGASPAPTSMPSPAPTFVEPSPVF
jgi:hypothetical protein